METRRASVVADDFLPISSRDAEEAPNARLILVPRGPIPGRPMPVGSCILRVKNEKSWSFAAACIAVVILRQARADARGLD